MNMIQLLYSFHMMKLLELLYMNMSMNMKLSKNKSKVKFLPCFFILLKMYYIYIIIKKMNRDGEAINTSLVLSI